MTQSVVTQTLGEMRVRVSFNPSGDTNVNEIKSACAKLIDFCETLKTNGERARCAALAQTALEDAAMWAVKAATWS